MAVSLVLPCYNPPAGWDIVVSNAYAALSQLIPEPIELVVVMDGISASVTEESKSRIRQNLAHLKIIEYSENRGKGYAIRQGVHAASGAIIIYTDIDFPYTTDSIRCIRRCKERCLL